MPTIRTEVTRPKGINKDLSPYELPPEVWSDGTNITFRRHRTNKVRGYDVVSDLTLSAMPTFTHYYVFEDNDGFLYASESEVYTTNGASDSLVGSGFNASRESVGTVVT